MYFPKDKRLDALLRVAEIDVLAMIAAFFLLGCSAASVTEDRRRVDLTDVATLLEIAAANGEHVEPFESAGERAGAQQYCNGLDFAWAIAYGYGPEGVVCFGPTLPGRMSIEGMEYLDLRVCRKTYQLRYRLYDHTTRVLECW